LRGIQYQFSIICDNYYVQDRERSRRAFTVGPRLTRLQPREPGIPFTRWRTAMAKQVPAASKSVQWPRSGTEKMIYSEKNVFQSPQNTRLTIDVVGDW